MAEKALWRVARDTWGNATGPTTADDWQAVVDAVEAAIEARRWKAWETLPRDGSKFDAWHRGDLASKPHRLCNCFTRDGKVIDAKGYTRDEKWLTYWAPILASAEAREATQPTAAQVIEACNKALLQVGKWDAFTQREKGLMKDALVLIGDWKEANGGK